MIRVRLAGQPSSWLSVHLCQKHQRRDCLGHYKRQTLHDGSTH